MGYAGANRSQPIGKKIPGSVFAFGGVIANIGTVHGSINFGNQKHYYVRTSVNNYYYM
jgi:hypothetical protein